MDTSDHPEWAGDDQHPGFFQGFGNDDNVDPPKRRKRRGRWAAPLISLAVIVVVIVAAVGVVFHIYQAKHKNFAGDGTGHVVVKVLQGDTASAIAPRLVQDGVIAATGPFVGAAENSSNPTGLQPGSFALHHHMSAASAWAALTNPKNQLVTQITIPDGERATTIIKQLSAASGIQLAKFTAALADPSALGLPSYAKGKPEGYLYPDTYTFQPGTTAQQMLQAMVKQFTVEAQKLDLTQNAATAQFSPGEVITAASILEAEVGPHYYPEVARVIDNRLNDGMKLQVDSTVLYGLGITGFNLTHAQLYKPTPYNTFVHAGLPPGPIDSPDAGAIAAVLHPAAKSNKYVYFVTIDPKTGLTKFTSSFSQFTTWSAESAKNIKNGT